MAKRKARRRKEPRPKGKFSFERDLLKHPEIAHAAVDLVVGMIRLGSLIQDATAFTPASEEDRQRPVKNAWADPRRVSPRRARGDDADDEEDE